MIWHDTEYNKPKHWQDVFIEHKGKLVKCKYDKSQDVFLEKDAMYIEHETNKWSPVNSVSSSEDKYKYEIRNFV